MFSVHSTPVEFKNTTVTGHFGYVLGKLGQENPIDQRFQKALFSNCFSFTRKRKADVFKFSGLKSVLEKLCFVDGLAWMVAA